MYGIIRATRAWRVTGIGLDLIVLSPHSSASVIMVRLSTVFGLALATTSVLIPGVLSQTLPPCAQTCVSGASTTSGCALCVGVSPSLPQRLDVYFLHSHFL